MTIPGPSLLVHLSPVTLDERLAEARRRDLPPRPQPPAPTGAPPEATTPSLSTTIDDVTRELRRGGTPALRDLVLERLAQATVRARQFDAQPTIYTPDWAKVHRAFMDAANLALQADRACSVGTEVGEHARAIFLAFASALGAQLDVEVEHGALASTAANRVFNAAVTGFAEVYDEMRAEGVHRLDAESPDLPGVR